MKPTAPPLCAAIACAPALLCLGRAGAQDKPSLQLDQLSGFLGDGSCTGNLLATKSPHGMSATYNRRTCTDHQEFIARRCLAPSSWRQSSERH
jgi:hypothetical protein